MMIFLSTETEITTGAAALYAVIGFLIVVAVLALLVGIFYLSGAIFRTKALSRDNLFARRKKADKAAPTETADDEETVAAITAAIAVILGEESGDADVKPDFVIRRVTRK